IKNTPTPDPTWFRSDVPAPLANLIGRMLMKDRPARLASARLVGAELESIQRTTRMVPAASQRTPVATLKAAAAPPTAPPSRIRVLIVDDHAVVRQGLRTF